jgi:hypothetical protein
VILDQYERTMTAMTGLEPRLGVIKDLGWLCNMTASPRRDETHGSRHGAMTDLSRCDNFVEQREHRSVAPNVVDVNQC